MAPSISNWRPAPDPSSFPLLIGLKIINDAGQELHADDLARAAIYNLKILHRRAGRGSATVPAPQAPA